jgi:hypothetical protein
VIKEGRELFVELPKGTVGHIVVFKLCKGYCGLRSAKVNMSAKRPIIQVLCLKLSLRKYGLASFIIEMIDAVAEDYRDEGCVVKPEYLDSRGSQRVS